MDKNKEAKEAIASMQEELQNYKDLLIEALQSIKDRIPDIETINADENKEKE